MHNYAHCTLLTHSIPHIHGRKYRQRSLLIWLLWSHTQTHTHTLRHKTLTVSFHLFGSRKCWVLSFVYGLCVVVLFFSCVFVADFSHSKWKECEFICTIDYIEIFVCDVVSGTADAITAFANCLPPHSSAHFILCCVQFKNSLRKRIRGVVQANEYKATNDSIIMKLQYVFICIWIRRLSWRTSSAFHLAHFMYGTWHYLYNILYHLFI